MRKNFNSLAILAVLLTVLLSACSTPTNVSYFQDVANNCTLKLPVERSFRLKPEYKSRHSKYETLDQKQECHNIA